MSKPEELRAAFSSVRTARLILRAVSEEDVAAAFAIHSNPETYRFHPAGVTRSREESATQLAGCPVGSVGSALTRQNVCPFRDTLGTRLEFAPNSSPTE